MTVSIVRCLHILPAGGLRHLYHPTEGRRGERHHIDLVSRCYETKRLSIRLPLSELARPQIAFFVTPGIMRSLRKERGIGEVGDREEQGKTLAERGRPACGMDALNQRCGGGAVRGCDRNRERWRLSGCGARAVVELV